MNVFHIIGPIMIGPSSSHTGGAVRIGRIASSLLESEPKKAQILLHGSFAQTYKGHGTDRALAAGILGMSPDDNGVRTSLEKCAELGIELEFIPTDLGDVHPNTVEIHLEGESGEKISLQGSSIGGGNIQINKVNGYKSSFNGQSTTILIPHKDKPGVIAAVTGTTAENGINIANFMLSRSKKGGDAIMTLELDGEVDERIKEIIMNIENVDGCTIIPQV